MARPQPGSIFPPQNHTVSLVYHVEDLGVNAMSVSKIAAMVAGLAEEKDKFGHEAKINYMIGFGVRFWSLVFHLNLFFGSNKTDPGLRIPNSTNEPNGTLGFDLLFSIVSR